jgi:hypothetical protein
MKIITVTKPIFNQGLFCLLFIENSNDKKRICFLQDHWIHLGKNIKITRKSIWKVFLRISTGTTTGAYLQRRVKPTATGRGRVVCFFQRGLHLLKEDLWSVSLDRLGA